MKRLVNTIPVIKKYIDIVVSIDDYALAEPVAAVDCIAKTFQPSIRKQLQLSDEAFGLYTNFLNSVLRVICNFQLDLKEHHQSKKSYAYYINIDHYGYLEDVYVKYEIMFRIDDHPNHTLTKELKSDGSGQIVVPVIKDIQIGRYHSETYNNVILHLNNVCKGIKEDDPNILTTDMTIFE